MGTKKTIHQAPKNNIPFVKPGSKSSAVGALPNIMGKK